MATIYRGTTPTLIFSFETVDVSNISVAVLTVKQNGEEIIRRELDSATVDESTISWTFTQEETLALSNTKARIVCDWLLADGTRGRSAALIVTTANPGVEEVLE